MDFTKLHLSEDWREDIIKRTEADNDRRIKNVGGAPYQRFRKLTNSVKEREDLVKSTLDKKKSPAAQPKLLLQKKKLPIKPKPVKEETYFTQLRREKEIQNLRERNRSNWRRDIQEEHPYVTVMPTGNEKEGKEGKKKKTEEDKSISL
jgi:hypothetical protein